MNEDLTELLDNPKFGNRLPPYWRRSITRGGIYNGVWIYTAWDKAAAMPQGRLNALLPPDADPREFCWPVRDYEVLVIQEPDIADCRIELLVLLLVGEGAKIVRVIRPDNSLREYK